MRNLSPESILYELGHLKLCSFKHAVTVVKKYPTLPAGPMDLYGNLSVNTAPEMMYGTEYRYSVDWWAMGLLLYRFVYNDVPIC
jgi:serine/threonine protein kinase